MLCFVIIENPLGREPWPSGYGRHLMMRGCGFESWCRRMDMKFFDLLQKLYCLFEKTKNKRKRGWGWPIFKNRKSFV